MLLISLMLVALIVILLVLLLDKQGDPKILERYYKGQHQASPTNKEKHD